MHLVDILALRQSPSAGLYLSLTRRCPLSCEHCSTNSTIQSEEYDADVFLRCVASFTPSNRPEVVVLTGGEPLIRPRLVLELIERAHAVGTKVVLASGMFFAREPAVPLLIERALAAADHVTVSLDVFHERQVARSDVFRVIQQLVDRGQDVSFLVVGLNEQDPYLVDVTADIQRTFHNRVPVLVGEVQPVGRAREWMADADAPEEDQECNDSLPCDLAAWPVVTYDGTVVACCNQYVVNGPAPAHLKLGHTTTEDWATLTERYRTRPTLRAIRVFGPVYAAAHYGSGNISCTGYCETCYRLSDDPEIALRLDPVMSRPAMQVMEEYIATLQQARFAERHGPPSYAHLVRLGYAAPALNAGHRDNVEAVV